MDNIFKNYPFVHVYVDDILITSNNIAQHIIHLNTFADVCIQHGLALLEKKAKIRLQIMLGMEIDGEEVKLQTHILEKIS